MSGNTQRSELKPTLDLKRSKSLAYHVICDGNLNVGRSNAAIAHMFGGAAIAVAADKGHLGPAGGGLLHVQ